ncbi:integrase [Methylobacterium sp. AMS5]|nr:integrase [Methylobacterium sp. AMS5]
MRLCGYACSVWPAQRRRFGYRRSLVLLHREGYMLNCSLLAARTLIEAWRMDYNTCRPHTSLGGLTPNAFATRSKHDQNQNGRWL